jgi:hypothetical protein
VQKSDLEYPEYLCKQQLEGHFYLLVLEVVGVLHSSLLLVHDFHFLRVNLLLMQELEVVMEMLNGQYLIQFHILVEMCVKISILTEEEIYDVNFWIFYDLVLEEEGSTKMMEEVEGVVGEYVLLYDEPTSRGKIKIYIDCVLTKIGTYIRSDFCLPK